MKQNKSAMKLKETGIKQHLIEINRAHIDSEQKHDEKKGTRIEMKRNKNEITMKQQEINQNAT